MGEFDLIQTYLAPLAGPEGLGLEDDAAVFTPPEGFDLVITKDTMVEGVHFPTGDYSDVTAQKLIRVNVSDLAAKAAEPVGYLLSLALPKTMRANDFDLLSNGLKDAQAEFGLRLFGGDTVRTTGPMVISATLIGTVPSGTMIRRDGANPGDAIYVTGTIGDAYLGLQSVLDPNFETHDIWAGAYNRPEPRLELRNILRSFATASVDVSDGLIADCGHLAKASNVKAVLQVDDIPLSQPTQAWVERQGVETIEDLLTAGDDYEIIFSVPQENESSISAMAEDLGFSISKIGHILEGSGVECLGAHGKNIKFTKTGYQHL